MRATKNGTLCRSIDDNILAFGTAPIVTLSQEVTVTVTAQPKQEARKECATSHQPTTTNGSLGGIDSTCRY